MKKIALILTSMLALLGITALVMPKAHAYDTEKWSVVTSNGEKYYKNILLGKVGIGQLSIYSATYDDEYVEVIETSTPGGLINQLNTYGNKARVGEEGVYVADSNYNKLYKLSGDMYVFKIIGTNYNGQIGIVTVRETDDGITYVNLVKKVPETSVYIKDYDYTTTMTSTTNEIDATTRLSIADIKSKVNISATSEKRGNITNEIYVSEDNYTPNWRQNGKHKIVFAVKDLENNKVITRDIYVNSKYAPTKPGVSKKDTIIANVSAPYTLEQIFELAGISVIDAYDGDITHLTRVVDDKYLPNKNIVGLTTISYSVTNSGGLTTDFTLNIFVKDMDAPGIKGPGSSRISYTKEITPAEIIAMYTVTDNYDKSIQLVLDSTNYVKNKVGTYTYTLSATDSSGHVTRTTHTLSVYDDVAPIMTNSLTDWKITYKQAITDNLLLSGLTAYDAVDGDITSKIKIKSHNIKAGVLGNYVVVYEVSDSSGNVTTLERPITIITSDYPIYYVSSSLISIESVNKMSLDEIAQFYAELNNIQMLSYEVIENEYIGNESIVGQYLLSMKIVDTSNIEYIISNTFNVVELPVSPELTWYENAWNWIYDNIVSHLVNFGIAIANGVIWFVRLFGSTWNYIPYK